MLERVQNVYRGLVLVNLARCEKTAADKANLFGLENVHK